MPNIDDLMDRIADIIQSECQGTVWLASIDLRYAYGQLLLHFKTSRQCNFSLVGGAATSTYRFLTGFYGLADMPAEFQQAINRVLTGARSANAFINKILFCNKGSLEAHRDEVYNVLQKLNLAGVGLNLRKCKFAQTSVNWLGVHLTQDGVVPLQSKSDGIAKLAPPRNLKQLRGLMGSAYQLNKFVPRLAELCQPFRSLLQPAKKFVWTAIDDEAFHYLKVAVNNVVKNTHFDASAVTRLTCDASKSSLGAVFEQRHDAEWKPIAYASRFLNTAELRYSINEFKLLGVVWAVEHFRNYLLGRSFTDHRALLSALRSNRGDKTSFSRLVRWVDRLLPFSFDLTHVPGKQMGWAHYLSRYPSSPAAPISEFDQNFSIHVISRVKGNLSSLTRTHSPPSFVNTHTASRQTPLKMRPPAVHTRTQNKHRCCAFSQHCVPFSVAIASNCVSL